MIRNLLKKAFCIRYSATHEWVRKIGGNKAQVGITHFAREELGEVVYVEQSLNEGDSVNAQEEIGTLESVKASAPVYTPITATILKKNENALTGLNKDAEVDGWLYEVEIQDNSEFDALMKLDDYKASI